MRRNVITILLCLLTAVGLAQKEKFPEPDVKAEPGEDDVIGSDKDAQLEAALKAIAE